MKLAAVSWTFGLEDLDDLFSTADSIGFKAMQYCGSFNTYSADEVLKTAQKYSIELVGYDPFDCRPAKSEEATLDQSVDFYRKVIDYTVQLKAPATTIQGLSLWTINQPTRTKAFNQIIEAVKQLNDYAKSKGVVLTYEACNHYETPCINSVKELLKLLQKSRADTVKIVVDAFHMNIDEQDPLASLGCLDKDLLYSYHVSDSGRGGIGTGHTDFKAQYKSLHQIGFDGLVCFEFVIEECRPERLPMNSSQMKEYIRQTRDSLKQWKSYMVK